jgi:membrane protease YdiL (CAAX protease family)
MKSAFSGDGRFGGRHRFLLLAAIGILPFLVNGWINARIAHSPWLFWSFELAIWVVLPAVLLLVATRTPGFRFADLGLHMTVLGYHGLPAVLLACLLFSPLMYGCYRGATALFEHWFPEGGFFAYETMIPETGILNAIVVLYFALSAGLVEEFLFRGLLWRAAQEFASPAAIYLLVSPLVFSLVHWESGLANLAATWVVGLLAAATLLLLKNLWPLIAGHVFTDLLWFG